MVWVVLYTELGVSVALSPLSALRSCRASRLYRPERKEYRRGVERRDLVTILRRGSMEYITVARDFTNSDSRLPSPPNLM